MDLEALEIDQSLKDRLNSLLQEFESAKIDPIKTKSIDKKIIVDTEKIEKVEEIKMNKKSLLNSFFERFFYTEYEYQ